MKIIAYTALHYGSDYLSWAIRSIIDYVDEYYVLYAAEGSHGHRTDKPCPDTRQQLFNIAQQAAGDKLHWFDGSWPYEGSQRDSINQICPDADVILVLDADEIWSPGAVFWAIEIAKNPKNGDIHAWRVPIIHYWRSFHRAVLHDPAYPVRIIKPKVQGDVHTLHLDDIDEEVNAFVSQVRNPSASISRINHFGYAQRPEIVEYKQHTHGHKGEWRQDDWFNNVFMANAQTNCHPVGSEYWNPERINPWDYLPDFMKDHPYANREVIE